MSKRTLFIIPGFREKSSDPAYINLKKQLRSKDLELKFSDFHWNHRTVSQAADQFLDYFEKNKSEQNEVLGFSFGAMIALITASKLKINRLFICSLSPCFAEDVSTMPESWKRFLGKKRVQDFKNLKMSEFASQIDTPTKVFLGEKEAKKFPTLKNRCERAVEEIDGAELIIVKNAPHDIGDENYLRTLQESI